LQFKHIGTNLVKLHGVGGGEVTVGILGGLGQKNELKSWGTIRRQGQLGCPQATTFHLHDCLVRNVLVPCLRLGLAPGLVVVIARDNDHTTTLEALKGPGLPGLGVREYVRL
jgi:hypothetical protein